jgi:rifampicin phosphotransferase
MTTTEPELVWPQIDGFWPLDKMHAPRPITPLSFDVIVNTLTDGFTAAHAEYDCPVEVSYYEANHYFFVSFHPLDDQAEIADRLTRYHDTLAEKVPTVGPRWENVWKPELMKKNYALKTADYSALDNTGLVAKLEEFTEYMRYMWWIHGHINFVLLSSSAFCDMYDAVVKPSDPTEAYQALQGWHTRSVDTSRGLWQLSRTAKHSPMLSELFANNDIKTVNATLNDSAEGRAFRAQLNDFLQEYGWRSDAVYDLADIPWREDPTIPLGNIAAFIKLDDEQDPEVLYKRGVKLREELLAKARGMLAGDPDRLAEFNESYEGAKYSFPITEDHAFYIDQLGVGVFRRFVTALGDKLVADGVFDNAEDAHLLYKAELIDALRHGGDRRALIAQRRASMAAATAAAVPPFLGTPPAGPPEVPDPYMDAVVVRLLGVTPPDPNPDPLIIRGVPGSPGQYTAKARVVRSLLEAGDLEDGEIMVCEMTLPPWVPMFSIAGGVVSDVGGVLSHCAIVAREFAIPAVVGSVFGTTRITTGQTITIDGTKGLVYLDGRAL